jgi:Holliday junction resolvase RusA-like endonuclease
VSTITFTVAGRPQQRGSKKAFQRQGGGRPLMVDANAKSGPWMAAVASAASEAVAGKALLEGPLSIDVTFHLKRPGTHFHKRKSGNVLRADAPVYHASTPDADKLMRAIGDALSGVVYRDDSQLAVVTLVKYYTSSSEGAVIGIKELTPSPAERAKE